MRSAKCFPVSEFRSQDLGFPGVCGVISPTNRKTTTPGGGKKKMASPASSCATSSSCASQGPTPLRVSSARGASQRSCSSIWSSVPCGGADDLVSPADSSFSSSSKTPRDADHPHKEASRPGGAFATSSSILRATHATSSSTTLAPVHHDGRRLSRKEPPAVRAATNKLAMSAAIEPHHGPGSGAPLNFLISRMRTGLERLELWKDDSDTDGHDSD
jgi:hypothetical protein